MWIVDILRSIFFFIDNLIYTFIVTLYNLLVDIAETSIFTEEVIDLFASKVYALLGVFMLFKVSFSIISYIVNPDEFTDKTKGFGKLIGNIIITLTLLIATPWIFSQAMDIQRIILRDNILGKIFSTSDVNTQIVTDPGNTMAYETFKAFYHLNYDLYPECEGIEAGITGSNNNYPNYDEEACKSKAFSNDESFSSYKETLQFAYATSSISIYMNSDLVNVRNQNDEYTMSYMPFISTLAGGAVGLLLIVFCFDVAVRSVKLGFLRMIAPIPIVSRIDPKKGKETFDKWVKVCVSTYLDLFIRLLAIYFAVFVITQLVDLQFVDAVTGITKDVNVFVKVFIILGALLFAKQLPKLLEDLTGMKLDGKFTLNPLKKLGEVPLAGGALAAGATVAGGTALMAGRAALSGVGGGAKLLAGKALHSKKLESSGKKTLGNVSSNAQKRWNYTKTEALGRLSSSGLTGGEYKGDTAHKLYAKEKEKINATRIEGKNEFAAINTQWQQGQQIRDLLSSKGKSFSNFDGKDTSAYKMAYQNDAFIKSLMNVDKQDAIAKEYTNAIEAVRAGGTATVNGTTYNVSNLADLSSEYIKATKTLQGLEKVHETMRKAYSDDAKTQDAIKFNKNNPSNPTK